jgi:hypothetical protein
VLLVVRAVASAARAICRSLDRVATALGEWTNPEVAYVPLDEQVAKMHLADELDEIDFGDLVLEPL